MYGMIGNVGDLIKPQPINKLYSITISASGQNSNKDSYEWYITFVSPVKIRNYSEYTAYMSGRSKIGVAGGGFRYTEDYTWYLTSGYISGTKVNLHCVGRPNYSGSYNYGFNGAGQFDVTSNVTFSCNELT